jgi:hypothetical protein
VGKESVDSHRRLKVGVVASAVVSVFWVSQLKFSAAVRAKVSREKWEDDFIFVRFLVYAEVRKAKLDRKPFKRKGKNHVFEI